MTTVAVALAAAATLFVPLLVADVAPASVRAAGVAIGLLYLPGRCLAAALSLTSRERPARAIGLRLHDECETAALAFALSLAMLVLASALAWAAGAGPRVAAVALAALTVTAAAARRPPARALAHSSNTREAPVPAALYFLAITAAAAVTCTALALVRTGSVDRWWTLAYVAQWATGSFDAGEPLLGTHNVLPRFALNVWTAALGVWTALSGNEALWLFERASPALLLPLGIAAHSMLGRALMQSRRGALLTALAAAACWGSGGPVAALSRAPEDKVLAAIVLAPVLWATGIRATRTPAFLPLTRASDEGAASTLPAPATPGSDPQLPRTARHWAVAAFGAALAVAAVHPLAFVLAAGPLAAYAALTAWRVPSARPRAAAVAVALLVASALPLASGVVARTAYVADGAAELAADHPVARVHRNRSRLLVVGHDGYVVDPRLLASPMVAVALVGFVLLGGRSARERRFLLPATAAPLAVAFVPPLAGAAGRVVLPWMVHRVLWAVPLPALAAVAADELIRRSGRRRRAVTVALAVVLAVTAAAPVLDAASGRSRAARAALAFPSDDDDLAALIAAVRTLPDAAVVAAPHELAERLPALAGVRVLAMSDRATIVFAQSRDAGERRLRARAALFAGVWRPEEGVPDPTHVLTAPESIARRYCADERLRTPRYVLCSFRGAAIDPGIRLREVGADEDGGLRVRLAAPAQRSRHAHAPQASDAAANGKAAGPAGERVECAPDVKSSASGVSRARPGPWSAEFPILRCSVSLERPDDVRARTLVVRPLVGSAVDELTVMIAGMRNGERRWNVRTRRRVHDDEVLRFGIPSGAVDTLDVTVAPSFLPFVKLRELAVTFERRPAP